MAKLSKSIRKATRRNRRYHEILAILHEEASRAAAFHACAADGDELSPENAVAAREVSIGYYALCGALAHAYALAAQLQNGNEVGAPETGRLEWLGAADPIPN